MEAERAGCVRRLDEVRETLELAAIKESSLQNVTQILYSMSERDSETHIKLLELDERLLETIKVGNSLMFKGNKQDSVVLCTKSQTYDIKEAETSNSCILIPNLSLSKQASTNTKDRVIKTCNVSGVFHKYYEVKDCKPKLEKLLSVLEPTSFKGIEYESTIAQELLYDWHKLKNEIQASEDELYQALNEYSIVNIDGIIFLSKTLVLLYCNLHKNYNINTNRENINLCSTLISRHLFEEESTQVVAKAGYYRLISFEFEVKCLTLMLDFFDENCWELNQVDKEVTYESLKEFIPKPVFDLLFAKYTETSNESKEDGTRLYRYSEEKCCRSLAKVLLIASPVTEYKQFMESWQIGTPEKMESKEEYLSGIALVTWNSSTLKKEVVSFSETVLSNNINERFNELFKAKDKWTVQEITPYIVNLSTTKLNVNALLTKYARCSIVNGIKYYSSKLGK